MQGSYFRDSAKDRSAIIQGKEHVEHLPSQIKLSMHSYTGDMQTAILQCVESIL